MIANVQTNMFSDDAWTPPMICQVLTEQLANWSRRSARIVTILTSQTRGHAYKLQKARWTNMTLQIFLQTVVNFWNSFTITFSSSEF